MYLTLEDEVVPVTGAAHGIGRGVALASRSNPGRFGAVDEIVPTVPLLASCPGGSFYTGAAGTVSRGDVLRDAGWGRLLATSSTSGAVIGWTERAAHCTAKAG